MVAPLKVSDPQVARLRKQCIRKFAHYFPGGFTGKKYISWERDYKWNAHLLWNEHLNKKTFELLLHQKNYREVARLTTWIESKTNLLFSFEKMALRDAVKTSNSAELFSHGLYHFIYGKKELKTRFENFRDVLASLPVKQTRVLTWPVLTVFGFVADPATHIYLKPTVTKKAAVKYGFDFQYNSHTNWDTYQSLLEFGKIIREDVRNLHPRDMIDIQSFIWVLGSDEYPD